MAIFGKLHLLVLHFPIALILMTALADLLWLWRPRSLFKEAGYFCIVLGALASIPTVVTGWILIESMNLSGEAVNLGEMHETLGLLTTMVALLAAVTRILQRNRLSGLWGYAYALLIAACVVLISLTGHYGGMLAFGRNYL
jgi:uncharacterized membrane protein